MRFADWRTLTHQRPEFQAEIASQKPKSHRRGIADGFGGLHKVACLRKDRAVKIRGCAGKDYMSEIVERNT
jgi:hypothetical protein